MRFKKNWETAYINTAQEQANNNIIDIVEKWKDIILTLLQIPMKFQNLKDINDLKDVKK